ncbi:hypothetical protein SEA_LILYPAD_90 [Gordonia phage LilyPad]|nr:hypothetical protein SEA_LILYPAD_90 [Gordonia phage LilyPad]
MARKQQIHPIPRERWSDEAMHAIAFAVGQGGKLSLGFQQYRKRFPSASAGTQIKGAMGGGEYVPLRAPQTPGGNIGST